jgi:predicted transcriptional regulator
LTTIKKLIDILGLSVFNFCEDKKIDSFYIGDLLSFVMGKADINNCWLTVMNNVNVCAVAALTESSCVILCEGVQPDENLKQKAIQQNLCLLGCRLPLFEAAKSITEKVLNAC